MIEAEHLPLVLPEVDESLPTETGEPPLGRAKNWAWGTSKNKDTCIDKIDGQNVFPLELNTMPGWAGSSWYFLRYMDAKNEDEFASKEAMDYWQNVDLYMGGSEHATGHLLYARFWQKFLFDRGLVPTDEFAKKLINQGMILGMSAFVQRINGTNQFVSKGLMDQYETTPIHVDVNLLKDGDELDIEKFKAWREDFTNADFILDNGELYECNSSPLGRSGGAFLTSREVEKMSKSKYNVVNPDDICEQYGADTLRLYEMFLGPLEQAKPWNMAGITGVHGFLKKLWKLYHAGSEGGFEVTDTKASAEAMKILHKTIKKVEEDIEGFSFNTSVSTFMIAVNELTSLKCNAREVLEPLAILISPYAPHIAEELWHKLDHEDSISYAPFPKFDAKFLVESNKEYPISFNGKMRFTMELPLDLTKEEIESAVMSHEKTIHYLAGRTPKRVIVVPGKIVNIVG